MGFVTIDITILIVNSMEGIVVPIHRIRIVVFVNAKIQHIQTLGEIHGISSEVIVDPWLFRMFKESIIKKQTTPTYMGFR